MRILTCAAAALAAALLVVAPGTAGKGGPSPDPLGGWDGVVAAAGTVRYVALPGGGTTSVAAVRVRDGRVLRYATVRGTLGIPQVAWDGTADGLSANGQKLVLASITSRPLGARTTFVVLRANTLQPQRRIELQGHWVFDAISPDGATIYAVQYADLSHYSVRAIDAVSGRVIATPIVDKREPDEEMRGSPMTRAWGPGRAWAYTLYSKPNGTAFVHALDTKRREALCLDLPWAGVGDAIFRVRLQVSADGRELVLRQPGVGTLATIDLGSLAVKSVHPPTG
jgi:hypothetical protein